MPRRPEFPTGVESSFDRPDDEPGSEAQLRGSERSRRPQLLSPFPDSARCGREGMILPPGATSLGRSAKFTCGMDSYQTLNEGEFSVRIVSRSG
ncbi:hypothetical protein NPIL_186031 [Nephila pilipes]|uniref:Uncharacterized protein n=1 Tax=Nephila pilipes TaxID=299642 RepID=A0A8X6T062_NEPPI|nr:hypothetical protein NPIL_186031 [Nephila pilipes]